MARAKIALFVLLLVLPLALLADDGSWTLTGEGSTVLPLRSTQVTMVAETVMIRPVDGVPPQTDKNRTSLDWCYRWMADCTFRFKNDSDRPADVLMGFPDTWEEDDWRGEYYVDRKVPPLHAIRGFETWLDGVQVSAAAKDPDPAMKKDWPKISRVLTWTVHFEPGQTREVRNRYRFGGGQDRNNSGDSLDRIDYVLKTGALWKGPIGSAEIRVYPGKGWSPEPHLECWGGSWIQLTWQHAVLSPCGFTWEKTPEPCFVWSLKDFVPKEDVRVFLVRGAIDSLTSPDEGVLASLNERRAMLLAARGMVFGDPALKARFEAMRAGAQNLSVKCLTIPSSGPANLYAGDDSLLKQEYAYTLAHWYTPDPSFKMSGLSPCEKEYIATLDKRIALLEGQGKAKTER